MRHILTTISLSLPISSVAAHGAAHQAREPHAWYELTNAQIQMLGWAGIGVGIILLCVSLYLYTQIEEDHSVDDAGTQDSESEESENDNEAN